MAAAGWCPRTREDKAGRRRSWQRVAALPGARGGRGGAGVRRDPSDEFERRQHLLWRPQQGQAGLPERQPVRCQGRRLLHPAVHVQKPMPALTMLEHVRYVPCMTPPRRPLCCQLNREGVCLFVLLHGRTNKAVHALGRQYGVCVFATVMRERPCHVRASACLVSVSCITRELGCMLLPLSI